LSIDLVRATSASPELLDLAVLILDLALVDKFSEIRLQNVATVVILEAVWMLDETLNAVRDLLLAFVHRSIVSVLVVIESASLHDPSPSAQVGCPWAILACQSLNAFPSEILRFSVKAGVGGMG
jgi:hypothetical protein